MTPPALAKILLVDDREENRLALEAILSSLGHELVYASSGAEALKCLLVEEVSLILLDAQMPEMDGYETASHIQRRPRTRDIPIVFLTALDHEAHHAYRGYAAGAVDFLTKPLDPWMLRAKVQLFIGFYQERQALRERLAELRSDLDRLTGDVDRELDQVERLLAAAGGDGPLPSLHEAVARLKDVRSRLHAERPLDRPGAS